MTAIEQAEDVVLWWAAAEQECPGVFREQLTAARKRLAYLQRAARQPAQAAQGIPQDTIDRIMDLVAMPDIIPELLQTLCGITLEWRTGAKDATSASCPFCGNCKKNFQVSLQTGEYYCWACPGGGSLKWLLLRQSGLGFRELFERLSQYSGVPIEGNRRGILI